MENYVIHRERVKRAVTALSMLNKYMGWIRIHYNHHTIYDKLEAAGFEPGICDAIHKLLYYEVDNPDILALLNEDGNIVTKMILDNHFSNT